MRDYGRVRTSFWTDDKIRALSSSGKLLAAYLLTCQHSNAIGCFRLPAGYIAEDLSWDRPLVDDCLAELAAAEFILRDDRTGWTLIPNFLKHNTIENRNVAIACQRMVEAIPKTFPFLNRIGTLLERYADKFEDGFLERFGKPVRIPEPLPEPEPSSDANASAPQASQAAPPDEPIDYRGIIFGDHLDWLKAKTARSEGSLRGYLGKACGECGDGTVLDVLNRIRAGPVPVDPLSAITAALKRATHVKRDQDQSSSPFDRSRANASGGAADDPEADSPIFGGARHGNDRAMGATIDGEWRPVAGDPV